MYENFKNDALKYYNPDGDLVWYRFTKSQAEKLLNALEKNDEILYGITIIKNPSEHTYGEFFGAFDSDKLSKENLEDFIKKSYRMARDYLKKIKEYKNETIYYEITIKSNNLDPI